MNTLNDELAELRKLLARERAVIAHYERSIRQTLHMIHAIKQEQHQRELMTKEY